MSWLVGARRHSHIKSETGIRPVNFPPGPTYRCGFFGLNLLPHARAVRPFQAEVMQVGRRRKFQRCMALFLELYSANGPSRQTLRHQLELVAILDIARHRCGVELALDSEEVRIRLGKMFGRKICREQPAHIFEGQFEEARSNGASQEGTD